MTILENLRAGLKTAMKSQDSASKDILRLAISEIDAAQLKSAKPFVDADYDKRVRAIIKSNTETIALLPTESPKRTILETENKILGSYLPEVLSLEKIKELLLKVPEVMEAGSVGAGIKAANEFFKKENLFVAGRDVSNVVNELKKTS